MVTDYELKRRIVHAFNKQLLNLNKECQSDPYSTTAEQEQLIRVTQEIRDVLWVYITGGKDVFTNSK